MKRTSFTRWCVRLAVGAAVVCLLIPSRLRAADHRDGPIFASPSFDLSSLDLNDLYIFQAPGNADHTVLILTVAAFAGIEAYELFNPRVRYEFRIDQNHDHAPDLTFRVTFDPAPTADPQQPVRLKAVRPGRKAETLASGMTRTNISIFDGEGLFRAGIFDDPFFFDALAFNNLVDDGTGTFPRPVGQATNFFGPNVNTLGIVIELPTAMLLKSPDRPIIEVWTRVVGEQGVQHDRTGLPFVNLFVIPPVPRNATSQRDLRNLFNRGAPLSDRRLFRDDVISRLTGFWQITPGRAGALTDRLLLPAVLTFDTSFTFAASSAGFPNGRRLRDDVGDHMLNLLSNGRIPTDNVADDNGDRITDGTMNPSGGPRPIAFPYIGAPNPLP